ncbi:MAG: ANTAR domain-containing response regulator [Nocardioides sp.]
MHRRFNGRQKDPVFRSHSTPTVLMTPDFVIRAATPSYLAATGRHEDELVDVNVFDAFPDNPATPHARSSRSLTEAIEQALRTERAVHLNPLRYDIPDPKRHGVFLEKRWVLLNTPILDGDQVIGVSIQVDDVTLVNEQLVCALRGYQQMLSDGDLRTSAARERVDMVESFLAIVESHDRLADEVTQLREALRSRPVIDQAKGIVMADRRCSADEAFRVLRQLSMDTNVRVTDVASAIVYQRTSGGPGTEPVTG